MYTSDVSACFSGIVCDGLRFYACRGRPLKYQHLDGECYDNDNSDYPVSVFGQEKLVEWQVN